MRTNCDTVGSAYLLSELETGSANMTTKDAIRAEINAIVRDRIRSGNILDVRVEQGENAEGEDILLVNVVFEGKRLDPNETSKVTRFVRSRLLDLQESRFPHFSYISKSDAEKFIAA